VIAAFDHFRDELETPSLGGPKGAGRNLRRPRGGSRGRSEPEKLSPPRRPPVRLVLMYYQGETPQVVLSAGVSGLMPERLPSIRIRVGPDRVCRFPERKGRLGRTSWPEAFVYANRATDTYRRPTRGRSVFTTAGEEAATIKQSSVVCGRGSGPAGGAGRGRDGHWLQSRRCRRAPGVHTHKTVYYPTGPGWNCPGWVAGDGITRTWEPVAGADPKPRGWTPSMTAAEAGIGGVPTSPRAGGGGARNREDLRCGGSLGADLYRGDPHSPAHGDDEELRRVCTTGCSGTGTLIVPGAGCTPLPSGYCSTSLVAGLSSGATYAGMAGRAARLRGEYTHACH